MAAQDHRIILASGSPRRRELLAGLGYEFTVDTGNTFEETYEPGTPAQQVPVVLAQGKSAGFHRPLEDDEILITSDTVVIVGDKVLGKPHSREEAFQMLRSLAGKAHEVVTAVVIRSNEKTAVFSDCTTVHFAELQDSEIDYYIDTCRPFDKAGAYGIQEWIGFAAISGIEGSYFNVMGFPTHRVYQELKNFL